MLRNLIDETYLKGITPELSKYLWQGETNYNKQKQIAETIVSNDFKAKGYLLRQLRPQLDLRVSGTTVTVATTETATDEDIANRTRIVINTVYVSGTATVYLEGSDDDDTYVAVKFATTANTYTNGLTITATAETTGLIEKVYTYYRCKSAGTIDYDCYLVEDLYDLFYAYKWLSLICYNVSSENNDQFYLKGELYDKMYSDLWSSCTYFIDKDDSGDLSEDEQETAVTARITH